MEAIGAIVIILLVISCCFLYSIKNRIVSVKDMMFILEQSGFEPGFTPAMKKMQEKLEDIEKQLGILEASLNDISSEISNIGSHADIKWGFKQLPP